MKEEQKKELIKLAQELHQLAKERMAGRSLGEEEVEILNRVFYLSGFINAIAREEISNITT